MHGFGVLVVTSALAALVALFVPVVRARTHVVPGPQVEAEAELATRHEHQHEHASAVTEPARG